MKKSWPDIFSIEITGNIDLIKGKEETFRKYNSSESTTRLCTQVRRSMWMMIIYFREFYLFGVAGSLPTIPSGPRAGGG